MNTYISLRYLPSRLVLAACLVMSNYAVASAQETAAQSQENGTGETLELAPITVLENQEDATGPVGDQNNPPTVTGSKIPVYASEVPQALTVLGQEDLKRFNATRVSETLRYTPGVMSDVFGDDNDTDWFRIRGFASEQDSVFLDNAQNKSYAFGSFYTDPYALERIEVLRGPSSALYGGSNPGGIANYVSKRPGERVRELVLGINDAVSGSAALDYGDKLENGQAYRVVANVQGGDKYDDFNSGQRATFAPSYKFTTNAGTEVTLLANLHIADEQHNGSTFLPYYGTVVGTSQFGYIDDDANFSDSDWDSYKREQFTASGIVEHTFDNDFTFTGIGRVGLASIHERYWYASGYTGYKNTPQDSVGTLALIGFEHDTLTRTAQTDLRYYGNKHTGAISHDLLFGLDARYYWLDQTQTWANGSNTVVGRSNPGVPNLGNPNVDNTTTQTQVGFYFQDQLKFGEGWIVTGNVRHDVAKTNQKGSSNYKRTDGDTSYRAAVAYEFNQGVTPYASYSTSFNPLIATPSDGVTEPEYGEQVEMGVKWAPDGSNFYLNTSLFQVHRDNYVTGTFGNYQQLGKVRSQGVELEGRYKFDMGLNLAAGATFLDMEILEDSQTSMIGKTPTLVPEHELTLRADYAFNGELDGWVLGTGVRHRGESFADNANTLVVPSSTIFDLYSSYELVEDTHLNLSVTNLADKRYVTGCQTATVCSYGAGREVKLTLQTTW